MSHARRLMGLETEYAVRFRSRVDADDRPTDYALFQRLLQRLREALPTSRAAGDKPGRFLATGGLIAFERYRHAGKSGLVEGATPECASPRELLAWQRAQDRLLAEAAGKAGEPDGEFVLLKNNRDSWGRSYGSHENYEATIATGVRLKLWRVGLWALLPLVIAEWTLLIALLIPLLLGAWAIALCCYVVARRRRRKDAPPPNLADYVGEAFTSDDRHAMPWPLWLEPVVIALLYVVLAPVNLATSVLLRLCAFHPQRRHLVPFLVTRTVVTGTGWLDTQGRFQLAQKAAALNRVCGYYFVFDRPMFSFGHLLEGVLMPTTRQFRSLRAERQRMQICCGDSNRCEEAEYLKLATTALVLEAIEAGAMPKPPHVWPVLRTLKRVAKDETLGEPVATLRGRRMTAIDVQRFYLSVCRRYVDGLAEPPAAARDVLARWEEVMNLLESDPASLIGRVDWITKRFLLQQAADLSWEARKKIDLRYHEVSPDGYFDRLQRAGHTRDLVTPEELDRAMRTPPTGSPAAVRGRYIREFADGDDALTVDWGQIRIGEGENARRVDLS